MSILSYQLFSATLSLLGVYLAAKENPLCWPVRIAGNLIAFLVYINSSLYIKSALTIFFIIDSIYGWYQWLYGGFKRSKLNVTRTRYSLLVIMAIFSTILVILVGIVTFRYTKTKITYLEAFAVFAIIAHWMMARKKLETWFIWITLDILYAIICLYKLLYIFAIKYAIYTIMAVYGYVSWQRSVSNLNQ